MTYSERLAQRRRDFERTFEALTEGARKAGIRHAVPRPLDTEYTRPYGPNPHVPRREFEKFLPHEDRARTMRFIRAIKGV